MENTDLCTKSHLKGFESLIESYNSWGKKYKELILSLLIKIFLTCFVVCHSYG